MSSHKAGDNPPAGALPRRSLAATFSVRGRVWDPDNSDGTSCTGRAGDRAGTDFARLSQGGD